MHLEHGGVDYLVDLLLFVVEETKDEAEDQHENVITGEQKKRGAKRKHE